MAFLFRSMTGYDNSSPPPRGEGSLEAPPRPSMMETDDESEDVDVDDTNAGTPPLPVTDVKVDLAAHSRATQAGIARTPTLAQFEALRREVIRNVPKTLELEKKVEVLRNEFDSYREQLEAQRSGGSPGARNDNAGNSAMDLSTPGGRGLLAVTGFNSNQATIPIRLTLARQGDEGPPPSSTVTAPGSSSTMPWAPAPISAMTAPSSAMTVRPPRPATPAPSSTMTSPGQPRSFRQLDEASTPRSTPSPMDPMNHVETLFSGTPSPAIGQPPPTHAIDATKAADGHYCICGKQLANRSCLQMHIRRFTEDKKFKCALCTGTFLKLCELRNHIRVKHKVPDNFGEGAIGCAKCGLVFLSRNQYLQHCQSAHNGGATPRRGDA